MIYLDILFSNKPNQTLLSKVNMTVNENKKLKDYLISWELTNPQIINKTHTSSIYTVFHENETVILKLLSESEVDEQRGAFALSYFDGRGAVKLLHADDGAQLIEYAPGAELVTLVERGEDEKATFIIAEVLQQLHGVPQDAPHDGLVPLDRWFHALLEKAAGDKQAGTNSLYMRAAPLAERLLNDQQEIRVLHGDIHHYNIRLSPRGWLAFDPKGLVGERTYDCANTLCNPVIPELVHNETRLLNNAAILAKSLSLDMQRVLAFTYCYACLNASWWTQLHERQEAEDIVRWFLKVARIIEPHIL